MLLSLLSYFTAIAAGSGQILNALSTPAPGYNTITNSSRSPFPYASASPSPICRYECPSDMTLMTPPTNTLVGGNSSPLTSGEGPMCYAEMFVPSPCTIENVYVAEKNICLEIYYLSADMNECRPGFMLSTYMNKPACIREFPSMPIICPPEYTLVYTSSTEMPKCVLWRNATCEGSLQTEEPEPTFNPSRGAEPTFNPSRGAEPTFNPSRGAEPTPLPTKNPMPTASQCTPICPTMIGYDGIVQQSQIVNGSCWFSAPIDHYIDCGPKGEYNDITNTCMYYYLAAADNGCADGYYIRQINGSIYCFREMEATYYPCPTGYKIVEYMGQRVCGLKVDPVCPSSSPIALRESASMTPKVVHRESSSPSITTKPVDQRESASPSMTPKVVKPSSSVTPSMSVRIVNRESASITPKVDQRESASPSITPKVVQRESSTSSVTPSITGSMTQKVVQRESSSASSTPKVATPKPAEPSASQTPKVEQRESSTSSVTPSITGSMTQKVVQRESSSASSTPKVAEPSASQTPKVVQRESASPTSTQKVVEPSSSVTPSMTQRVINRESTSPTQTRKPIFRTLLPPSPKPEDTYLPVMNSTSNCNIWVCPAPYELKYLPLTKRAVCVHKIEIIATLITLPDHPEGSTGGFYYEYSCPAGYTMLDKSYCTRRTSAKWIACPTPSIKPFPSVVYITKKPASTAGPSRRPIFWSSTLSFTGVTADVVRDPNVIKKIWIGLACSLNDVAEAVTIKRIVDKLTGENITIASPTDIDMSAKYDCGRMYPSASPSASYSPSLVALALRRELQGAVDLTAGVEVVYDYQPTFSNFNGDITTSAMLQEVATEIGSTVVVNGMVDNTASTEADEAGAGAAPASAPAPMDRDAIVGGLVGATGFLGLAAVSMIIARNRRRRRSTDKLMASTISKNPIVIVDVADRWASAPTKIRV
jgi:hypothetical protein